MTDPRYIHGHDWAIIFTTDLNISESDWQQTPASVRAVVIALYYRVQQVDALKKRIAELEGFCCK